MKTYIKRNDVKFGGNGSKIIKEELDYIDKIIYDYDNLTNKEKYELIDHFYYVSLEKEDFVKLVNLKHNSSYTNITNIPTNMEDEYISSELHGREFNLQMQKYQVILTCACKEEFVLENKLYTFDEVTELIKKEVIYPIFVNNKKIDEYSNDATKVQHVNSFVSNEMYAEMDWINSNEYGFVINEDNLALIINLIELNLKKEDLLNGVKKYLFNLIEDLHYAEWRCTNEEVEMKPVLLDVYNNGFKKVC